MKLALALLFVSATVWAGAAAVSDLSVTVDKSVVLEQQQPIRRIAITNGDMAEAIALNHKEILLNGKAPGDTTLLVWDVKGVRSEYDIHVLASTTQMDGVRGELASEVGPDVSMTMEGKTVFLRGTVTDQVAADRAASIAGTLGKVINLLRVAVPAADPQILLKVRFANVNRSASQQLGTTFSVGDSDGRFGAALSNAGASMVSTSTVSNLIGVLYGNAHFNINAAIQALEAKSLLQILAEPNLLTVSGKPASFLAGGEFPFPTIQGGAAGVGQITVQFKEFGIRLNFLPTVTPRGTIRMTVTPEVSSLDYSNGLAVNGFTVPGLSTRRVQTEVELQSGESFVIAGLLDNQVQEQLSKIPGLGNVPILGKLFQSRSITKSNTELLVMVTPELVRPVPPGVPLPSVAMPLPYLGGTPGAPPQQPGPKVTGDVPPLMRVDTLPYEFLKHTDQPAVPAPAQTESPTIPMLQPPPSSPSSASPQTATPEAAPTVQSPSGTSSPAPEPAGLTAGSTPESSTGIPLTALRLTASAAIPFPQPLDEVQSLSSRPTTIHVSAPVTETWRNGRSVRQLVARAATALLHPLRARTFAARELTAKTSSAMLQSLRNSSTFAPPQPMAQIAMLQASRSNPVFAERPPTSIKCSLLN